MNFYEYKKEFNKRYFCELKELTKEERLEIPKENKKVLYEYLKKKDIIFKNNTYYKKISQVLTNEEILLFSQMKSLELISNMQEDIYVLKNRELQNEKNLKVIRNILILWTMIFIIKLLL